MENHLSKWLLHSFSLFMSTFFLLSEPVFLADAQLFLFWTRFWPVFNLDPPWIICLKCFLWSPPFVFLIKFHLACIFFKIVLNFTPNLSKISAWCSYKIVLIKKRVYYSCKKSSCKQNRIKIIIFLTLIKTESFLLTPLLFIDKFVKHYVFKI